MSERRLNLADRYPETGLYQPHRNVEGNVCEELSAYVSRMKSGPLANWPEELLSEWLFRHADDMEDYAFLGFSKLHFCLETWETERFPSREAFRDMRFCDSFQDVEIRARENAYDWLAHYMLREGTWNTPIVLFNNEANQQSSLRTPFHLLEGHRRLSFLQGLIRLKKTLPRHTVWIVSR